MFASSSGGTATFRRITPETLEQLYMDHFDKPEQVRMLQVMLSIKDPLMLHEKPHDAPIPTICERILEIRVTTTTSGCLRGTQQSRSFTTRR